MAHTANTVAGAIWEGFLKTGMSQRYSQGQREGKMVFPGRREGRSKGGKAEKSNASWRNYKWSQQTEGFRGGRVEHKTES